MGTQNIGFSAEITIIAQKKLHLPKREMCIITPQHFTTKSRNVKELETTYNMYIHLDIIQGE